MYIMGEKQYKEVEHYNKLLEDEAKEFDEHTFKLTEEQVNKMDKDGFIVLDTGAPIFRNEVHIWHSKKNETHS